MVGSRQGNHSCQAFQRSLVVNNRLWRQPVWLHHTPAPGLEHSQDNKLVPESEPSHRATRGNHTSLRFSVISALAFKVPPDPPFSLPSSHLCSR